MQSRFRGWQARGERRGRLVWILKLQRIWRGKVARARLAELGAAAGTVQAHWRGRRVRLHNAIERSSALLVQARWRGKLVRMAYRRNLAGVLLVQARWRGRRGRERVRLTSTRSLATHFFIQI